MALTPKQKRSLDTVGEADDAAKIAALESEEMILKPYATTKDLPKLKARLVEIRAALYRLRGFPLES